MHCVLLMRLMDMNWMVESCVLMRLSQRVVSTADQMITMMEETLMMREVMSLGAMTLIKCRDMFVMHRKRENESMHK